MAYRNPAPPSVRHATLRGSDWIGFLDNPSSRSRLIERARMPTLLASSNEKRSQPWQLIRSQTRSS
ncbi:hypothetical protein F01_260325 [Burkholderia cenocepacia]|nr:hypothetical protein F01_260325 [Burkholderia cenocepacia]